MAGIEFGRGDYTRCQGFLYAFDLIELNGDTRAAIRWSRKAHARHGIGSMRPATVTPSTISISFRYPSNSLAAP